MAPLQRVYPLATLPFLVIDDRTFLAESSLIVEYFDLRTTGPRLVPSDPTDALWVRNHDRFADGLLSMTQYLAFARRKPEGTRNEKRIAESQKKLATSLGILDARLVGKTFLHGERLSLGDVASWSAIWALIADGTIPGVDAYPAVRAWHERLAQREAFARIVAQALAVRQPF
jgi:glutathione S-transferase